MTERRELADEVSGAAVLVDTSLVEVGAEVDEAGVRIVEQVPNDDEDGRSIATSAFILPVRLIRRRERAPRKVSGFAAAAAASPRTRFR